MEKNHLDPYVSPYIKINFRWISGLHVKTRELLEESVGAYLCGLNEGRFF